MSDICVKVIGAGLAGSEAAWQLARRGVKVELIDMKPQKFSPAHKNSNFSELVCSNSLRSDDYEHNAVGLLHQEMRLAGSLIMQAARWRLTAKVLRHLLQTSLKITPISALFQLKSKICRLMTSSR